MSELTDLFAIWQGEESPDDYTWIADIPVPDHPLKNLEIRGTSREHCMEKARRVILDWRNYFGWEGIDAAEEIAKSNCREL
ncbi:hypothetical protein QUB40_26330 [Microcoleus sp. AT9_A2]|uniref:hypothetical protein n=1 Tax=Microcoleus sp. AT9_A2 TaxID=2818624 RepID=UPI002FD41912